MEKFIPKNLFSYLGYTDLLKRYPFLESPSYRPSLFVHGPPASGKTTLLKLLAQRHPESPTLSFHGALDGVGEIKKEIQHVLKTGGLLQVRPIVFIDEIHRLNKAQQDILLHWTETHQITLYAASTEKPFIALTKALLSRVQVIELKAMQADFLQEKLHQAWRELRESDEGADEIIKLIVKRLDKNHIDTRFALSLLEMAATLFASASEKTLLADLLQQIDQQIQNMLQSRGLAFDTNNNEHFHTISAFIKSLRGSDPDSALIWLQKMLQGGEDPLYIARRMMIFASEDVGNADPFALSMATNALIAIEKIGLPEGEIILGQAVTYLALAPKSNASYLAVKAAKQWVSERSFVKVPDHLHSHSPHYLYPHSYPERWVNQNYWPANEKIQSFYRPLAQKSKLHHGQSEQSSLSHSLESWHDERMLKLWPNRLQDNGRD
jgi:putative ATPase